MSHSLPGDPRIFRKTEFTRRSVDLDVTELTRRSVDLDGTELTRRSVDLDVTEVQHVCRRHLDGHELTADVIAARQRLARRRRKAGRLQDAHLVRVEV